VEQLHQLGLKNNRRTKTIRNRDRKYKLYTQWAQLSGKQNVQRIKKEVHEKRKRKLQHPRGAVRAAGLLSSGSCTATRQLPMDWGESTAQS
jgi:uncharacterized protein (DUF3084 family)